MRHVNGSSVTAGVCTAKVCKVQIQLQILQTTATTTTKSKI